MESLADKVVLITGASSGIGAASALNFAKHGSSLALTGRNEHNLNKVGEKCRSIGVPSEKMICVTGDLTKEEDVLQIVRKVVEHHGRIDILVNNAGTTQMSTIAGMSMDTFDSLFNINLRSVVVLTKLCIPHIVKSKGSIINISSCSSSMPSIGETAYCMTKAALDMFTRGLSLELSRTGVRVNSVNPGEVKTDIQMRSGVKPEELDEYYASSGECHPIGRCGDPEEIAKVISFLASDSASFMMGSIVAVDGGLTNTAAWTQKEREEHL